MTERDTDTLIVSRAHDWMQALPLVTQTLVCADCGVLRRIADLKNRRLSARQRCRPTVERAASGFKGPALEVWLRAGRTSPAGIINIRSKDASPSLNQQEMNK